MALSTNLVSYWSLDEASGNAVDGHSSNDLTDNNTVGTGTGKVGNARDFESGSSEDFSHTDNTDLSTGNIDFTFAGWIKPESLAATMVVWAKLNASDAEYKLEVNADGSLMWVVYGASGFGSFNTVSKAARTAATGTWLFVVCDHDSVANEIGISVNGGARSTTAHSAGAFDSTGDFRLGSQTPYAEFFDGLIDEVGFWKRVLTSDERTELYNGGDGMSYDDIVGGGAVATGGNLLLLGVG